MTEIVIPARLKEIVAEFRAGEGTEKLELLHEYAHRLPALPAGLDKERDMDLIRECAAPIYVCAQHEHGQISFYFDIPPQAATARGFAAMLSEGLRGATPEQVINLPPTFYYETGLQRVISGQRLRAIDSMLAHIKQLARQFIQSTHTPQSDAP